MGRLKAASSRYGSSWPPKRGVAQLVAEAREGQLVELRLDLLALVGAGAASLGQVHEAVLDEVDVVFLDGQRVAHARVGHAAKLEHFGKALALHREAGIGDIGVEQLLVAAQHPVAGQAVGHNRHDLFLADALGDPCLPALLASRGSGLV